MANNPTTGKSSRTKLSRDNPLCEGSPTFDPDAKLQDAAGLGAAVARLSADNDLQAAITSYFDLPADDDYVYHAITSVTLAQVQRAVSLGAAHGLHIWYRDQDTGDKVLPPPPSAADCEAYVALFLPTTDTASALRSLGANAKRGSVRAGVAEYLTSKRFIHQAVADSLAVPKLKAKAKAGAPPPDPYLAFWAWSVRNLEWCGPSPLSGSTSGSSATSAPNTTQPSSSSPSSTSQPPKSQSHGIRRPQQQHAHPILPILMHHFGCAAPTHEALCVLRSLAAGRRVADLGCGNGYWAWRLRAAPYSVRVVPVDNAQSAWRTNWVRDVVVADAVAWLRVQQAEDPTLSSTDPSSSSSPRPNSRVVGGGGPDMVLLMVYPIVGGGVAGGQEGGFTRGLLDAYTGDTVAVVGTQNHNGYTGFRDMTMDDYMARERPEWTRVVQIPLPSFAGKDEALFVFQRGQRAPPLTTVDGGPGAA